MQNLVYPYAVVVDIYQRSYVLKLTTKVRVLTKVWEVILKELAILRLRNRGIKDRRDLYVINNTTMSLLIVKGTFIDSSLDTKIYNIEKPASAIYKRIWIV